MLNVSYKHVDDGGGGCDGGGGGAAAAAAAADDAKFEVISGKFNIPKICVK